MATEKLYPAILQEAANTLKRDMIANVADIVSTNPDEPFEELRERIHEYLQDFVVPNMGYMLNLVFQSANNDRIDVIPTLSFSVEFNSSEEEAS
jgi:5-formyltetrahydrofolate cyclo-ligase